MRILVVVVLLIVASLACNLTPKDENDTNTISDAGSPPTVTIRNAPAVGVVNQPLTIEIEAIDPTGNGVTRAELRVNNIQVDEKPSQDPRGTTPFVANLTWTPPRVSTVTLQVIAWRNNVASQPATLQLNVGTAASVTQTPGPGSTSSAPIAPTLGPCRARVDSAGLRLRSTPDTSNDNNILTNFALNEEPLVLGRLANNSWYQVRDTTSTDIGWVSASFVTLLGACNTIAVVAPPASPTPAPTNTLPPSAQPSLADLVALPISGRVSVQLGSNGTVTENYSMAVQNIGGRDSGPFEVLLVLPGGQEITRAVQNLAPGAIVNLGDNGLPQQSVTFTAPGTQRISVSVDFRGVIQETNEGNNITFLDVNVEGSSQPSDSEPPPPPSN